MRVTETFVYPAVLRIHEVVRFYSVNVGHPGKSDSKNFESISKQLALHQFSPFTAFQELYLEVRWRIRIQVGHIGEEFDQCLWRGLKKLDVLETIHNKSTTRMKTEPDSRRLCKSFYSYFFYTAWGNTKGIPMRLEATERPTCSYCSGCSEPMNPVTGTSPIPLLRKPGS